MAREMQHKEAEENAKEEFHATLLLLMANSRRYKKLKDDLENQFTMGTDVVPKTTQHVITLLESYNIEKTAYLQPKNDGENLMFN